MWDKHIQRILYISEPRQLRGQRHFLDRGGVHPRRTIRISRVSIAFSIFPSSIALKRTISGALLFNKAVSLGTIAVERPLPKFRNIQLKRRDRGSNILQVFRPASRRARRSPAESVSPLRLCIVGKIGFGKAKQHRRAITVLEHALNHSFRADIDTDSLSVLSPTIYTTLLATQVFHDFIDGQSPCVSRILFISLLQASRCLIGNDLHWNPA